MTGKKVTIVAHSMGNLNVLYNLGRMPRDLKRKMISNYVALAPPYLGSYKATKTLAMGNDEYLYKGTIGFHFNGSVKTTSNQVSLYELLIKNP